MWKEFKEFAFKGNVVDLAIGLVIGAAFGAIVISFVNNIINPLVGLIGGGKAALDGMKLAVTPTVSIQLRRVPERGRQLPDRRVGALPGHQGGQPVPQGRGVHRTRVPLLPDPGSQGGHQVFGVHVGTGGRGLGSARA